MTRFLLSGPSASWLLMVLLISRTLAHTSQMPEPGIMPQRRESQMFGQCKWTGRKKSQDGSLFTSLYLLLCTNALWC